jgi:hypothetical protein
MRALRIAIYALAASTISQIAVAPAHAEDNTNVWTCWDLHGPPPEPVGDRPGHSLAYNQVVCRVESGPLAGGLATGDMSWEWDGANSKELTFRLIVHKPGASAVLRGTSGGMALIMTDGKVTGVTGSGRYDYVLTTGSWAPLAGKSETWTFKGLSPQDFSIEGKLE